MDRATRGEWEPGGKGWVLPLIFQCALVEALALRGIGYVSGRNGESASLGSVEDALPLWLWGTLFLLCAAAIVVGMATRTYFLQIGGHGWAAAFYAGIGWGVLADAVSAGRWEQLGAANGLIVLGVVMHGGWAFGTASQMRRKEIVRSLDQADR